MGAAEVISFEEVRARKQWDTLRQQLHERFDQWLDTLETAVARAAVHLTGGDGHGVGTCASSSPEASRRLLWRMSTVVNTTARRSHCPQCDRVLRAREHVCRTVETMVGPVQLERPYFYCRPCRCGLLSLR